MNFIYTVLLVLIFALLAFVALLCIPRRSDNNSAVNVRIDDGAKIMVRKTSAGYSLDISYDSYLDRPSDAALFPDIVNTAPSSGLLSDSFWYDLANADRLSDTRRGELLNELVSRNFLSREKADRLLQQMRDDGGERRIEQMSAEDLNHPTLPFGPQEDEGAPSDDEPTADDIGNLKPAAESSSSQFDKFFTL